MLALNAAVLRAHYRRCAFDSFKYCVPWVSGNGAMWVVEYVGLSALGMDRGQFISDCDLLIG